MPLPRRQSARPEMTPPDAPAFIPESGDPSDARSAVARAEKPQIGSPPPGAASQVETSVREAVRRHPYLAAAAAVSAIAIAVAAIAWWLNARHFESTDDAFIDARVIPISAQVSGAIVDVPVTDNQLVEAGAVLVSLDERDYRAAVAQAKGQVEQAQAGIANLGAQIEQQQARIEQAQKQ